MIKRPTQMSVCGGIQSHLLWLLFAAGDIDIEIGEISLLVSHKDMRLLSRQDAVPEKCSSPLAGIVIVIVAVTVTVTASDKRPRALDCFVRHMRLTDRGYYLPF